MTDRVEAPALPTDKARNQQRWGVAFVVVGLALQVVFFYIFLAHSGSDDQTVAPLSIGTLLCMIGLGVLARAKSRTVWWFLLGWAIPIVGPALGLGVLLLGPRFPTRTIKWAVIVIVIGILVAIGIPNYLRREAIDTQFAGRNTLAAIYAAEQRYYQEHHRYGNFEEIGFEVIPPPDFPNRRRPRRYTYRIGASGAPGTVILATTGPVTPEHTTVRSGISVDPPGFTVTATGNLDSDRTIDQWHVNDSTDIDVRRAWKPDMDDVKH